MTTTVKAFNRPNAMVSFTNIVVDIAKCTFELNVSHQFKGKNKIHTQNVSGTITPELRDWLSTVKPEKVRTVGKDGVVSFPETGVSSTGFQKFLKRTDREFVPGILSSTIFTSENNSEDYYQNPFKLIMLNERNILTLVNIATKKRTETSDPMTGKKTVHYTQRFFKNGNDEVQKSFTTKKNYFRLILQQDQTVEVSPEQVAQAEV